ncbi:MAG: hypothetical protein K6U87_09295 [Firmicutes bacterium]|nr:hypothetical protein [Bacillota bacterium]
MRIWNRTIVLAAAAALAAGCGSAGATASHSRALPPSRQNNRPAVVQTTWPRNRWIPAATLPQTATAIGETQNPSTLFLLTETQATANAPAYWDVYSLSQPGQLRREPPRFAVPPDVNKYLVKPTAGRTQGGTWWLVWGSGDPANSNGAIVHLATWRTGQVMWVSHPSITVAPGAGASNAVSVWVMVGADGHPWVLAQFADSFGAAPAFTKVLYGSRSGWAVPWQQTGSAGAGGPWGPRTFLVWSGSRLVPVDFAGHLGTPIPVPPYASRMLLSYRHTLYVQTSHKPPYGSTALYDENLLAWNGRGWQPLIAANTDLNVNGFTLAGTWDGRPVVRDSNGQWWIHRRTGWQRTNVAYDANLGVKAATFIYPTSWAVSGHRVDGYWAG